MERALFVYNPISGDHHISGRLSSIIGRFQDNGVLLQPYRLAGEEQDMLQQLLHDGGYSYVIAAGGDGTLNLIVNALLKSNLNLPLGIIPSGTCNDFARSLQIPSSLEECLDIILSRNTSDVDAGLINGDRYFLNTCAGGIFVDVSFNTNHELKKNLGPFAYYLKAIGEVPGINAFNVEIQTDTDTIKEQVLLFVILNGKHGGGFPNLVREADVSDGLMDIVLVKNCSHMDMAVLFFRVLTNDTLDDKNVTLLKTRTCRVKGSSNVILSVDGEKGPSLPIAVTFINRAIKVFTRN
ncbi:MAG: YegS/Rv2252/BmrU family lipid kinase [Clostridiales bacterium]|nr:YegS/Rv2252/BmrU family lipid kinase [Eubacteriales bacterium]MDH7565750.1 YegS/Rv2252/BmrU family lipid kinase [Clostridiales bacterium]